MKKFNLPFATTGGEFTDSVVKSSKSKSSTLRTEHITRTVEKGLVYMDKDARTMLFDRAENVGQSYLAAALSVVVDSIKTESYDEELKVWTYTFNGLNTEKDNDEKAYNSQWRNLWKGEQSVFEKAGNRSFSQLKVALKGIADGADYIVIPYRMMADDGTLVPLRVLREIAAGMKTPRETTEKVAVSSLTAQLTTIGEDVEDVESVGQTMLTENQALVALKLALGYYGQEELFTKVNSMIAPSLAVVNG